MLVNNDPEWRLFSKFPFRTESSTNFSLGIRAGSLCTSSGCEDESEDWAKSGAHTVGIGILLFRCSVVSDSLWPHGLHHARLPCPSSSPRVCQNSCPWVGDAIQPSHPLLSTSPLVEETSTRETKHHNQRVGELRFITAAGPEELTL